MNIHGKSAREVLEEVNRLEKKRDEHHPQYDNDLRNKEKTKAYELMKAPAFPLSVLPTSNAPL